MQKFIGWDDEDEDGYLFNSDYVTYIIEKIKKQK